MINALVIEDNRDMSDSLCQMLALLDVRCQQAFTPRSAFNLIEQSGIPQLVFLDINLPTVDGFEVLAYLRRDPRLIDVPVILVTSNDQPETYRRAAEGEAVAVIIKPASLEALEAALANTGLPTG